MSEFQKQYDKALELEKSNNGEQALQIYNSLIHNDGMCLSQNGLPSLTILRKALADDKLKEQSIYRAGEILAKLG